jgi:FKBP-type peptidyl-prolyl cis-trans isomerase SlyD
MNVTKENVVSINYTLKNDDGQVLDSSADGNPLVYLHGVGQIIPGLEKALEGKTKGEKVNVTIPPEEAYGPRNDQMIQTVPKSEFEDADTIEVGVQFQADTQAGPMIFTVIEVKDNDFVLDGNHPLAGMTLHFDVEVSDVRAATAEEISHGHVHGPGGHDH